MTAETFRAALRPPALLPALLLAFLSGCAATADEPAPQAPEPKPEASTAAPPEPSSGGMAEPAPGPAAAPAEPLLRPDYPEEYAVQKGDTLWDIASRFLEDPWRWPEIWYNNPQVENPHLIYPGDILTLTLIDGKPRLQVQQRARPTVKLSPKVRAEPLERAIPTLPLDAIQAFLRRPRVVEKGELDDAPYLVANADGRLLTGGGDQVYARGLGEAPEPSYHVVRLGDPYTNPEDPEDILGYEVRDVADARLVRGGDPATLDIVRSNFEVRIGDRLLSTGGEPPPTDFHPATPEKAVEGRIISVLDGVTQIGQHDVVVLDLGAEQGMERGHVLAVYQTGETIEDPRTEEQVKLPDERAGTLMVFRTFDRLSYALVMGATRTMHVLDTVRNP